MVCRQLMWVLWVGLFAGCAGGAMDPVVDVEGTEVPTLSHDGRASVLATHVRAPATSVGPTTITASTREVVVADPPPTPLYGGSLAISRGDDLAVAADPDRDLIWVVDLVGREVARTITLEEGAEPWRIAEDDEGRFHVTLRGGGQLLSFDRTGEVVRRAVCAAPRGVATDGEVVHVACAEGLLVTLPTSAGEPTRVLTLDEDLRDVVVDAQDSDVLYVSRFRSAEVLVLDADGVITERLSPVSRGDAFGVPGVAYRMRGASRGGVWLLHQRASIAPASGPEEAPPGPPVYYGAPDCVSNNLVPVLSYLAPGIDPLLHGALDATSLAVDFAFDWRNLYVVAPGTLSITGDAPAEEQVRVLPAHEVEAEVIGASCHSPYSLSELEVGGALTSATEGRGAVWFLSREPAALLRGARMWLELPGPSRADDGFDLFHLRPGEPQITCAGCHPEGGEDGFTWDFGAVGAPVLRRTQTMRGGLTGSEPFHWAGDMVDFSHLVDGTMMRMGGRITDSRLTGALQHYVDGIERLPVVPSPDPMATARGRELFASISTRCAECHSGERLSNDATVDVGTGGAFQVPSLLRLRYRAPYLHDGSAATVRSVLTDAHTDGHGEVAHLTSNDVDALVAYLESL
jgi:mono/diheme cytochrome c family protein